ncbi:hypothetical protein Tco_0158016 [Tanacetum coccineum]
MLPHLHPPLPVASPPLPLPSPLTTSPTDAGAPLGYKAAVIQMRAASPPLILPSTSHRTDIPEAEMPPQKRAVMEMGYGITDTWDEIIKAMLEVASTTLEGVNQRVTELSTTVRQENEESQVRFEDAQDDRAYLRARVNTLFRDRPYHRHTAMILDREAMYARIAWTSSKDRSAAIEAHKMPPKRRTPKASPTITTTPTSTPVTDAQLKELIERGVAAMLAERDAYKSKIENE